MKFRASKRGGSEAAAARASRAQASGYFERKDREEKRARLKQLRAAARLAKKQLREACSHKRGNARLISQEGRREVAYELKADLERIDTECARRAQETVTPIVQSVEQLAGEIRASIVAQRHGRAREKARPKLSGREAQEARWDEVRHDLEVHDRRLLPVFERVKRTLKPTERQTLTEAFLELVAETPELLEAEQTKVEDLDLECAQAIHEAQIGNDEAKAWAKAHCTQAGAKKRPKGSAASRTLGMFGPGLVPPVETAAAAPAAKPERKRGGAGRTQQSLAGGLLGDSFLDVPF